MTHDHRRFQRRALLAASAAGAAGWLATTGGVQASEAVSGSPSVESESAVVRWSRQVPIRYEADVAVIGGGIAGVSAACAAARSGARVVLVERFAVTGGDLTTGGVANFCGDTKGQGEVFDAIVADLEKFDAVAPYKAAYPEQSTRVFEHHVLAFVLQELLLRRGVKLLLHTQFVDACANDAGRITACIVCGKSGPEALQARQFIDCTGEADVARRAGFAVTQGRPEDGLQLPMSIHCFVRHVEPRDAGPPLPDGWLQPIQDRQALPMTSVWPNGPRGNSLKIKIPKFDATDTQSLTAAEIQGRRRALEVLHYYLQVEHKPWRYDGCSPQIGIREGARVVGDYVLTVDDLRAGRAFEDGIARGLFYLDGHKPDDEKRTYILPTDQRKVPPYQIPLRSLLVRDGANLLAAGRCFSADQLALSSARVSTTCSMMGQAAGIAAALAAGKHGDPRRIDAADVRRILVERGARLEL
ncbi:MAG: FAD-dependent oxidoreductase [Candidatus Anammoximicrobium sp.]|nr:FAD-dependent oxidoreductase [Candidatus Anammoximicrobium sp.]